MTTILKCHVTLRVGPLILSHHPAKFGSHRPYETVSNGVYNISSNCSSSSNVEVPMLRFINGHEIVSFPNLSLALIRHVLRV